MIQNYIFKVITLYKIKIQKRNKRILNLLNRAVIKILDPSDYPQTPFEQDMEISLVHELLHLHFALFEPKTDDSLEFLIMESTIEQLANILVEMKRTSIQD